MAATTQTYMEWFYIEITWQNKATKKTQLEIVFLPSRTGIRFCLTLVSRWLKFKVTWPQTCMQNNSRWLFFFCIASNIFLSRSLFTLFGIDKIIKRYRTKPFYNNHATYAARPSNHFLSFFYNITFKFCSFFPVSLYRRTKEKKI